MSRNDENVEKVHQVVLADCCRTNDEISEITCVMEFMPTHFNGRFDDETGGCKIRDLQKELKDDPQFLTKVVVGDDSWSYGYDPESEQQSSQWKSPNTPKTNNSATS